MDEHLEQTGQTTPEVDSERYVSYRIKDLWPKWQEKAHCAGTGYENYFGEDDDDLPTTISQVRRASKLCDVCPVFEACLRHALEQREEYGVWAGTSGRTRRKLFKMLDKDKLDIEQVVGKVLHERDQRGRQPASPIRQRRSGGVRNAETRTELG